MKNHFNHSSLRLLELKAVLGAKSDIVWNSFPGSVLHGALGYTTRRRSCVIEEEKCEGCYLLDTCLYSQLFETRTPKDSSRMKKYPRIPPGLRLTFDGWDSSMIEAGEEFEVGLIFLGGAINTTISLLLSLQETFEHGIGSKNKDGSRGRADLLSINGAQGENIGIEKFNFADEIPIKITKWAEFANIESSSFTIRFVSPTRIVSQGRITENPDFRDIFATVLRRVSNVAYFHCDHELDVDYKGLVEQANHINFKSQFRRIKVSRYSARQMRRTMMDGIVGEMSILDCPEELLPWIAIGSKLGIGKNTSMGTGEYIISSYKG